MRKIALSIHTVDREVSEAMVKAGIATQADRDRAKKEREDKVKKADRAESSFVDAPIVKMNGKVAASKHIADHIRIIENRPKADADPSITAALAKETQAIIEGVELTVAANKDKFDHLEFFNPIAEKKAKKGEVKVEPLQIEEAAI